MNSFLENLSVISNKEYQKRVWIEALGPECDDFDEAVCDFFDLGEYIFDNFSGYEVTESQAIMLLRLRDELREFSRQYDLPQEFIETPEWAKIMAMAKEILEAFHYPGKGSSDNKF